jgi:hypothetical protein
MSGSAALRVLGGCGSHDARVPADAARDPGPAGFIPASGPRSRVTGPRIREFAVQDEQTSSAWNSGSLAFGCVGEYSWAGAACPRTQPLLHQCSISLDSVSDQAESPRAEITAAERRCLRYFRGHEFGVRREFRNCDSPFPRRTCQHNHGVSVDGLLHKGESEPLRGEGDWERGPANGMVSVEFDVEDALRQFAELYPSLCNAPRHLRHHRPAGVSRMSSASHRNVLPPSLETSARRPATPIR